MSIRYNPQPVLPPIGSGSGGYDFGYGGGNYGWNSGTGYYPYGGGYGNPYGYTQSPQIIQQYIPVPVRPPQQVGQQYVNTTTPTTPVPTTVSKVPTVQSPEDYLEDHQQIVGNKVIGKDAPTRLWDRFAAGVQDWWDPTQDRDQRGGVWVEDPLVPNSKGMFVNVDPETGYGGTVEDMVANAPQSPQPQPPKAETVPNQPLPDDPRNTNTGQLKHFGMNALLSQADAWLTGQRMQAADDRAFNNLIRTRQWLDPNNINFITRQQMTPFGKSRLLNEATSRTQALTSAATDAANRKLALRQGLLAMKQGAIGTATAGLNRTYAPGIG